MRNTIIILFFPFFLLAQSTPNIIVLMSDDQGYGEFGFTTSTYTDCTPNIDSLKNNGAFFSRFYVRPICTPTRFAFMTANYPFEFEGNQDFAVQSTFDTVGIPKDTITLPEQLKEHGYTTMHIGKWHLGSNMPDYLPLKQGFDKSFGSVLYHTSMQPGETIVGIPSYNYNQERYTSTKFATEIETDTAVAWIAQQAKDNTAPFFLYMAYTNPHDHATPFGGSDSIPYQQIDYDIAPVGLTSTQKAKWASVFGMDRSVGRIIDTLAALGIDNNTIVIFTSDNGGDDTNDADNGPYTGDKGESAEGGVRVPLIWYHPGTVDSMRVDSLCSIIDLFPSIIEGVLGGTVRRPVDGINFHPLLSGASIPTRYYIGPIIENRLWSVYKGSMWKLTNNNLQTAQSSSSLSDNIELFNMRTDSTETTDVSGSNASIVAELTTIRNTAANVKTARTLGSFDTRPSGWDTDPRWWGDPVVFYLSGYLYQLTQIDK